MPLPKGTKEEVFGKFKIWVTPTNEKYLEDAKTLLAWTDQKYTAAGLPLGNGPIQVLLAARGGSARSVYEPNYNVIWMVPSALRGRTQATFIHEFGHWYHHNKLGMYNQDIVSQFDKAMALNFTRPAKSDTQKVLLALRKELEGLREEQEGLELGGLHKGLVIEKNGWDNPHVRTTPYVRKYKVLSVKGKVTKVELLNPSPADLIRKVPTKQDEVTASLAWEIKTPAEKERVTELRKLIDEKAEEINRFLKSEEFSEETERQDLDFETRYERMLNEWVPTDYARTNVMEWWAELLTVFILHPTKLTDTVKDWIKSIVR